MFQKLDIPLNHEGSTNPLCTQRLLRSDRHRDEPGGLRRELFYAPGGDVEANSIQRQPVGAAPHQWPMNSPDELAELGIDLEAICEDDWLKPNELHKWQARP